MKRFAEISTLIVCLTFLLTTGLSGMEFEEALTPEEYEQLSEDIEIMARIIDKIIEPKSYGDYMVILPGELRGCQGFYLKDYGVIFVTAVNFPVAGQKEQEKKQESTPANLWQQTKVELESGGVTYEWREIQPFGARGDYDYGKVEKLKWDIVRVIGEYSPNIRHLDENESIVVAVRGFLGGMPESANVLRAITTNMARQKIGEAEVKLQELQGMVESERQKVHESANKVQELQKKMEAEQQKIETERRKTQSGTGEAVAPSVEQVPKDISVSVSVPKVVEATVPAPVSATGVIVTDEDKEISIVGPISISASGKPQKRTTLIIRVSIMDAIGFKNGEIDSNELLQGAEITQY